MELYELHKSSKLYELLSSLQEGMLQFGRNDRTTILGVMLYFYVFADLY